MANLAIIPSWPFAFFIQPITSKTFPPTWQIGSEWPLNSLRLQVYAFGKEVLCASLVTTQVQLRYNNLMKCNPNPKIKIYTLPQTWYGRLLATVVGALVLLLGIFFFTLFLVIFALLAIVLTIYISFSGRRPEKTPSPNIIHIEYSLDNSKDEPSDPSR
jgi:hypothetical protein